MIEPRMEIKLGAKVSATDGASGRVQRVVVDPLDSQIISLIVRPGLLANHSVLVPIRYVIGAADEEVHLNISRAQVTELQGVNPAQYHELVEARQGFIDRFSNQPQFSSIDTGSKTGAIQNNPVLMIQPDQRVYAQGRPAGEVSRLLFSPTGHVKAFVLRKFPLTKPAVIVPAEYVSGVDQMGVHLALDVDELNSLTEYASDQAIAVRVEAVLWNEGFTRSSGTNAFKVEVLDGVVTLNGHVANSMIKSRIQRSMRRIRSVVDVENRLIADDELEISVAQEIARHHLTQQGSIFVGASRGVIHLNGKLSDPENRLAAERCAAGVPQVRGVVNTIQAPGVSRQAAARAIFPQVNDEVYASDMYLGRVEHVVINPENRLVAEIVVRGGFPDFAQSKPGMKTYQLPLHERLVSIPVGAIRHTSPGGVHLSEKAWRVAKCPDFHSGSYIRPAQGWQPPYPYQRSEVYLKPFKPVPVADGSCQG
jgi:osmotically-inducible protein OsmY/sporulation protein YlmC with PRC-barrel domain